MMSENAPSSCEKTPENEFLIIVYKFVNQYITSSFWTICTLLKIGGGSFWKFFQFPLSIRVAACAARCRCGELFPMNFELIFIY